MDDIKEFIENTIHMSRIYMHIGVTLLCWTLMFISVLIDMWDGVSTAKVMHEKIQSKGLRKTFSKAGDYWRMMLFGFMFDTLGILFSWYLLPYLTILITLGVLIIEFRSVWEHNKRKKSHAAELPETVSNIIKCATEKDALNLIKEIKEVKE